MEEPQNSKSNLIKQEVIVIEDEKENPKTNSERTGCDGEIDNPESENDNKKGTEKKSDTISGTTKISKNSSVSSDSKPPKEEFKQAVQNTSSAVLSTLRKFPIYNIGKQTQFSKCLRKQRISGTLEAIFIQNLGVKDVQQFLEIPANDFSVMETHMKAGTGSIAISVSSSSKVPVFIETLGNLMEKENEEIIVGYQNLLFHPPLEVEIAVKRTQLSALKSNHEIVPYERACCEVSLSPVPENLSILKFKYFIRQFNLCRQPIFVGNRLSENKTPKQELVFSFCCKNNLKKFKSLISSFHINGSKLDIVFDKPFERIPTIKLKVQPDLTLAYGLEIDSNVVNCIEPLSLCYGKVTVGSAQIVAVPYLTRHKDIMSVDKVSTTIGASGTKQSSSITNTTIDASDTKQSSSITNTTIDASGTKQSLSITNKPFHPVSNLNQAPQLAFQSGQNSFPSPFIPIQETPLSVPPTFNTIQPMTGNIAVPFPCTPLSRPPPNIPISGQNLCIPRASGIPLYPSQFQRLPQIILPTNSLSSSNANNDKEKWDDTVDLFAKYVMPKTSDEIEKTDKSTDTKQGDDSQKNWEKSVELFTKSLASNSSKQKNKEKCLRPHERRRKSRSTQSPDASILPNKSKESSNSSVNRERSKSTDKHTIDTDTENMGEKTNKEIVIENCNLSVDVGKSKIDNNKKRPDLLDKETESVSDENKDENKLGKKENEAISPDDKTKILKFSKVNPKTNLKDLVEAKSDKSKIKNRKKAVKGARKTSEVSEKTKSKKKKVKKTKGSKEAISSKNVEKELDIEVVDLRNKISLSKNETQIKASVPRVTNDKKSELKVSKHSSNAMKSEKINVKSLINKVTTSSNSMTEVKSARHAKPSDSFSFRKSNSPVFQGHKMSLSHGPSRSPSPKDHWSRSPPRKMRRRSRSQSRDSYSPRRKYRNSGSPLSDIKNPSTSTKRKMESRISLDTRHSIDNQAKLRKRKSRSPSKYRSEYQSVKNTENRSCTPEAVKRSRPFSNDREESSPRKKKKSSSPTSSLYKHKYSREQSRSSNSKLETPPNLMEIQNLLSRSLKEMQEQLLSENNVEADKSSSTYTDQFWERKKYSGEDEKLISKERNKLIESSDEYADIFSALKNSADNRRKRSMSPWENVSSESDSETLNSKQVRTSQPNKHTSNSADLYDPESPSKDDLMDKEEIKPKRLLNLPDVRHSLCKVRDKSHEKMDSSFDNTPDSTFKSKESTQNFYESIINQNRKISSRTETRPYYKLDENKQKNEMKFNPKKTSLKSDFVEVLAQKAFPLPNASTSIEYPLQPNSEEKTIQPPKKKRFSELKKVEKDKKIKSNLPDSKDLSIVVYDKSDSGESDDGDEYSSVELLNRPSYDKSSFDEKRIKVTEKTADERLTSEISNVQKHIIDAVATKLGCSKHEAFLFLSAESGNAITETMGEFSKTQSKEENSSETMDQKSPSSQDSDTQKLFNSLLDLVNEARKNERTPSSNTMKTLSQSSQSPKTAEENHLLKKKAEKDVIIEEKSKPKVKKKETESSDEDILSMIRSIQKDLNPVKGVSPLVEQPTEYYNNQYKESVPFAQNISSNFLSQVKESVPFAPNISSNLLSQVKESLNSLPLTATYESYPATNSTNLHSLPQSKKSNEYLEDSSYYDESRLHISYPTSKHQEENMSDYRQSGRDSLRSPDSMYSQDCWRSPISSQQSQQEEHKFRRRETRPYEFGNQEMRQSQFEKQDARQSEFGREDMPQSEFQRQDMRQSEFEKQHVRQSEFGRQDMPHSEFARNDMRQAEFGRKGMPHSGFGRNDIRQSEFGRQDMRPPEFGRQNMRQSEFEKQDNREYEFGREDARQSEFRGQDMRQSGFGRQDIPHSKFGRQDIPHSEFGRQDIPHSEFGRQDMPHSEFGRQDMPHSEFGRQDMPHSEVMRQINFGKERMPQFEIRRGEVPQAEFKRQEILQSEYRRQEIYSEFGRPEIPCSELKRQKIPHSEFDREKIRQSSFVHESGLCPSNPVPVTSEDERQGKSLGFSNSDRPMQRFDKDYQLLPETHIDLRLTNNMNENSHNQWANNNFFNASQCNDQTNFVSNQYSMSQSDIDLRFNRPQLNTHQLPQASSTTGHEPSNIPEYSKLEDPRIEKGYYNDAPLFQNQTSKNESGAKDNSFLADFKSYYDEPTYVDSHESAEDIPGISETISGSANIVQGVAAFAHMIIPAADKAAIEQAMDTKISPKSQDIGLDIPLPPDPPLTTPTNPLSSLSDTNSGGKKKKRFKKNRQERLMAQKLRETESQEDAQ